MWYLLGRSWGRATAFWSSTIFPLRPITATRPRGSPRCTRRARVDLPEAELGLPHEQVTVGVSGTSRAVRMVPFLESPESST